MVLSFDVVLLKYWFSFVVVDGTSSELRVPIGGRFDAGMYFCRIFAADNADVMSRFASLTITGIRRVYTGFSLIFFVR